MWLKGPSLNLVHSQDPRKWSIDFYNNSKCTNMALRAMLSYHQTDNLRIYINIWETYGSPLACSFVST